MDYFNNVLSFLAFEHGSYICVPKVLWFWNDMRVSN